MQSTLLVSSSEKVAGELCELLRSARYSPVTAAKSGVEARRLLSENEFDTVIINSPLTDEFGHELAIKAAEDSFAAVVIMAKSEIADEISEEVETYGVFVLAKPFGRAFFFQVLKLLSASRQRLSGLRNENTRLLDKIQEIRIIDRAKCVLIQHLNMTEQNAHRYIEKQAMDMRITRRAVAEGILKTYET